MAGSSAKAGSNPADGNKAAPLIARAKEQIEKKDTAAAIATLNEALTLEDCSADLRLDVASLFAAAGANNEAVTCYLDAGTHFLYDAGDMPKARAAFAAAHQLDAANLEVIFQMGQADVVEGRTQDALAKFIDVLRKSNLKHVPALFEAGCIYQSNGQYDQAILAFKKVLDRDKNHVQAIVHMGQLHQTKGMVPESLGYYLQAADIARECNQFGTAQQLLNMVLALDGNNQKARIMLDDLLERSQEHDAESAVLAAAKSAPQAPAAAPEVAAAASAPAAAAPISPELAKSAAEAERALAALLANRDVLQREVDELLGARLDVEAAIAQTKDETEAALASKEAALAARAAAEREAGQLTAALERQKVQLAEATRRKAELDAELGTANAALHAAKKTESEMAASSEKRRAQLEIELGDLAEKVKEAELAAQAALAMAASAQAEHAKVEAEAKAEAKASRERSEALAKTKSSDENAAVAAGATLQEIQSQIQSLGAQQAQAQSEAAAAAAARDKVRAEAAAAEANLVALRERVTAAEAAAAKTAQLEAASAQAAKEMEAAAVAARDKVHAEAATAEANLVALRERVTAAEAAAAKTAALEAASAQAAKEMEAAAQAANAKRAEALRAAEQAEALRIKSDADAKALVATLEELRAHVDTLGSDQAKTRAEVDAAIEARDKLRAEVAAAQANLTSLQERVKSAASSATDAEKLKKASAKAIEMEAAAQAAAAQVAAATAALEALESRKHEIDETYAKSKSLAAAADAKRAEAMHAAEQAEALRAKREADAEALAGRIASLESMLKDKDARAQLIAGESAALQEVTAKVTAQRKLVLDLEGQKGELDSQRKDAEQRLVLLRDEIAAAQVAFDEARNANAAQGDSADMRRRVGDEWLAGAVVATVPGELCSESLRAIESLAAEGEIPFEIAAELAGLIHEGRAVEALRVSRARANLEAAPAPYILAAGDLARDLGDAAGARESYRMLAAADPTKEGLVHQRMLQLFLTFADQGTAAALQRDDAHYAAAQEPAKALEAYADLVARFPNDPTFRQELGETHQRIGNVAAAGIAFTQAMTQYLGGDDWAKAVELVPKLLAVRGESGEALELAARAFERAGRSLDAQAKLDDALRAYRQSKSASDVERVCRRLADIAEDPVPYRRELAALLQEVGDNFGASEQLVEAAERLVKWASAADALSLLKEAATLAAGNAPLLERIGAIKEIAAEAQRSVDHAARAAMFLSKKQYDKAADAYRAAVDKNPYNADACYQLACLLTDHFPDYATAEQLLENAAELRPGHTATRYRLALVKAARGDVEQAVELLIALARFDEHNGDFIDQFVERLEKDADGGSVAAKYRLGIAYRELGRLEEALVILQSIQRSEEYIVLCLNAIGLCLRRQGLDTAAAKRFQKAIETPGYPENQYNEALYNLGDLYETKRDPESLALSLSSFEELYARDCTYRDVADRIKSVKAKLGAAEGPKVKRLPNRSEAVNER